MKRDKEWFKGLKWAESIFKEMYIIDAYDLVQESVHPTDLNPFEKGAQDYCQHVLSNPSIFGNP